MDPRYSPFNITTAIMLGLTIWTIVVRFRGRLENSWPLVYYLLLVIYANYFSGRLTPQWIYLGAIAALFLRFEFMGGFFLKFVRAIDLIVLAFLSYRLYELVIW